MNPTTTPLANHLGVAAFLLYLIKPHWLENSLLEMGLVLCTLLLTTTCVLSILIKTIKPTLFQISKSAFGRNALNAALLTVVSIKVQEVFPVYVGIVLGMVMFAVAFVVQYKKLPA